jgi:C4-dicarboxylate-binding protein DctP
MENVKKNRRRPIGRRDFLKVAGAGTIMVGLAGCGVRGGGAQGAAQDGNGGGSEGEKVTIKFSHVQTPDTPKGLAAEKFKEVVEKESDGRIEVEIYPNSQLYGDEDEQQALQSGAVQMIAPAPAKLSTVAPQLQVLDLPFIADSPEEIQELFSRDSKIGQAIYNNEELQSRKMKVLGLWDLGFKQFASKQPIRTPEDMRGMKLRIQSGSDVLRSETEIWGGEPIPMSFSEVYNALQQGVIDGLENTYTSFYGQKMHTVTSHMTESNHGYIGYVLLINNDFFEGLPKDLQQDVITAADEATKYNRKIAFKENAEAKKKIQEAGTTEFIELSEAQREAFRDPVVTELWDQYADVIGPELIDELKERQGVR